MRLPQLLLILGALQISAGTAHATTLEEGKILFAETCAACHGERARGDGPEAANLSTQPADLTKIAARRDGIWPILEVMSIIDGYTKQIAPREDMPIIEEITDGPMIEFDTGNGIKTTIPTRLLALAEYLESIQSPQPKYYVP